MTKSTNQGGRNLKLTILWKEKRKLQLVASTWIPWKHSIKQKKQNNAIHINFNRGKSKLYVL